MYNKDIMQNAKRFLVVLQIIDLKAENNRNHCTECLKGYTEL